MMAHEAFVYVQVRDPRAQPLLAELADEYRSRYADVIAAEDLEREMTRYPEEDFTQPRGAFVLLLRDGVAVAGGAFMPHADEGTAEFKRIWASRRERRKGLARRVLVELEAQAARQGYTRVFLGTGPRQPEAVGLYTSSGYTLLSAHDFGEVQPPGYHFEKRLPVLQEVQV
ncbi:GNAT family N-acetyltransferase [Paraburkholderia sp. Ac-20340]|nr:GNAT family N-acetyltransferase [Paraburkholderia sp. Ac-20340]